MEFPRQNIPESQKDKDWYENCVLSLVKGARDNDRFRSERIKDYENYDFYNGKFNIQQFEYVTSINGITNPARLVNYPLIQPKMDLLAGELVSSDLTFTSSVLNRNAVRQKTEDMINRTVEAILSPIRRKIEAQLKTKLTSEEEVQLETPSVKEIKSTPYRTNTEKQIHAGVKWLIRKWDAKHVFKHGFYDLGITAKEFYRNVIENNVPRPVKIDPRSMIYDHDTDSEFLHQAAYAGHENYYTISEILDKYRDKIYEKYSKKEADEIIMEIEKLANFTSSGEENGQFEGWNSDYYLTSQNGTLKVSEVHMQWKGIKKFKFVEVPNKYSPKNPYYKVVKDDYKPRKNEKLIVKPVAWVYEGIMIGGRYLIDWGEKEDQVRYEDNYFDTKLDYFGCTRNNFNGRTLSIVDALKNIQILYNIVHYHIELQIQRSGGKSMVYDLSQKPKNIKLDDIFYHAKNSGLILINSAQEGLPSGFNQFQQVDFTLSQSVQQLINFKMVLEDTADKLTGITAARSGITKSGDLVGVNERNVMQSSLLTAPYFEIHYKVVGDVLQDLADKLRLCVRKSKDDYYVDIFGDDGIKIMKIDRKVSYEQVGIFIENSAKEVQRRGKMEMLLERFFQSGELDPITAIKSLNAESSSEIEQIITSGVAEVRAATERMEEQKIQVQQQANEIQKQTNELELTKTRENNQTKMAIAQMEDKRERDLAGLEREKQEDLQEQKRQAKLDEQMLKDQNIAEEADRQRMSLESEK